MPGSGPWAGAGDAGAGDGPRMLGLADGALPDDASVFDQSLPGVANLDAELLGAVRRAAQAAAADGEHLVVDSGWRSRDYQAHLLTEAVATYGSADEAARWVAAPDRSEHVRGHAIDLGPKSAAAWLGEHGAAYGLCRTYDNEPWHFELRPAAATSGCPAPYADPTHDPRMHQ
ncbi:MAG: D-alanyl-D-alanine carboxypeptidase family protein [Solirubrobacteraceae bacterium]|nr:D-alanyl-D-alanine carboxypeptidase family protein [Solirubrobacteraceae bacterium]